MINYDMKDGEKLDRAYIKANLNGLNIDPEIKANLRFVLVE
jgi:hypothetical protein